MTVHEFCSTLQYDVIYEVPKNCTFDEIKYYAYSRFNFTLKIVSFEEGKLIKFKRYCLHCGR